MSEAGERLSQWSPRLPSSLTTGAQADLAILRSRRLSPADRRAGEAETNEPQGAANAELRSRPPRRASATRPPRRPDVRATSAQPHVQLSVCTGYRIALPAPFTLQETKGTPGSRGRRWVSDQGGDGTNTGTPTAGTARPPLSPSASHEPWTPTGHSIPGKN